MATVDRLLSTNPALLKHFAERAADPSVSGDMLLAELRAVGLPVKRTAVFKWRRQYRVARRHRPNTLAGRVAAALRNSDDATLAALGLPPGNAVRSVFKLGRKRLYAIARRLGLWPGDGSGVESRSKRA
ncbi:MAG: hypothetical protein ACTHLN_14870 [Tepidisphaeraceae bacterium]